MSEKTEEPKTGTSSKEEHLQQRMLKHKVAIITGSSSGLGQSIAVHFAAKGIKGLVIHGRNEAGLEKTKELCKAKGIDDSKIAEIIGDITHEEVQQALVNCAVEKFGTLDILVNNAGAGRAESITASSMEIYDQIMDLNVRSVISITKLAIPHLINSKGCVVNISSGLAVKPMAGFSFYGMSKAALDYFTKTLALELGPQGVRVNSVCPGPIPATSFGDRTGMPKAAVDGMAQAAKGMCTLGRAGKPVEVAKAVAFLSTDQSSFTTGSLLMVDGGFHIHTPTGQSNSDSE